jgi:N-methylhydantoinase A
MGCLVSDLRADFVRSLWQETGELSDDALRSCFVELEKDAREWLADQHVDVLQTQLIRSADLCYDGQSFELNVVFPDEPLSVAALERWFHDRYELIYGFADRSNPIRIMEARTQIVGLIGKPNFDELRPFATGDKAPVSQRRIFEQGKEVMASVYQRSSLKSGDVFDGPAVVEQYDTTVYIPDGFQVSVDRWYNLVGERLK